MITILAPEDPGRQLVPCPDFSLEVIGAEWWIAAGLLR